MFGFIDKIDRLLQALNPRQVICTSDPQEIHDAFFLKKSCHAAILHLDEPTKTKIYNQFNALSPAMSELLPQIRITTRYEKEQINYIFSSYKHLRTLKEPLLPHKQLAGFLKTFASAVSGCFPNKTLDIEYSIPTTSGWHTDSFSLGCTMPLEKTEHTTEYPGIWRNNRSPEHSIFFFDRAMWHKGPSVARPLLLAYTP